MMGMSESCVRRPVLSPVKINARMTVKIGALLLTVSVKETVTY